MFNGLKERLFGRAGKSKSNARNRLHFVLVQDRAGLTNEEMSQFRSELMEVIERYFVVNEDGFNIDYRREHESTVLLINSPVLVRRQGEVGGGNEEAARAKLSRAGRRTRRRVKGKDKPTAEVQPA